MHTQARSYHSYWGKSQREAEWHLLPYHSLDVAASGVALIEADPALANRLARLLDVCADGVSSLLGFILALHDIGKFAESFQNLNPDVLFALQGKTSAQAYNCRHDTLGWWMIKSNPMKVRILEILAGRNNPMLLDCWPVVAPLLLAVMGHHGKPPALDKESLRLVSTDSDINAASDFVEDAYALFQPPCILPPEIGFDGLDVAEQRFKRASWEIAGFILLSDWFGSNEAFKYIPQAVSLETYWQEYALPTARELVRSSQITPPLGAPVISFKKLFPAIKSPTPLQLWADTTPILPEANLYIIEEATGSGKTEAAFTLAARMVSARVAQGVFFALPSMATSNSIYARARSVYRTIFDGKASLVLAHGGADLQDSFLETVEGKGGAQAYSDSGEAFCAAWLADTRKKALLASFGVGTIDQVLLSVLPVRHQSLRLLGLARNVLIIDEVHAYDEYMQALLREVVQFHASSGGTTVLLSATLPSVTKEKLIRSVGSTASFPSRDKIEDYPLVTVANATGCAASHLPSRFKGKRVEVSFLSSLEKIAELLSTVSRGGRCAVWIRNTVDDAIEAFQLLRSFGLEKSNLILFHARFTVHDRRSVESQIIELFGPSSSKKERSGKILIATQVVEQSLDLDFDCMVSDLAPMDLLIQRAGRLHRHIRTSSGERTTGIDGRGAAVLTVFAPELSNTPSEDWYSSLLPRAAWVYPHHGQLWLAAVELAARGGFNVPEDYRALIEAVYGNEADERIPSALHKRELAATGDDKAQSALGLGNVLKLNAGYRQHGVEWTDEVEIGTRIGDETTSVILVKRMNESLVPLHTNESEARNGISKRMWFEGMISIRKAKLFRGSRPTQDEERAKLELLKENSFLRWKEFLICNFDDGAAEWRAQGFDAKGNPRLILYNSDFGLRFGEG